MEKPEISPRFDVDDIRKIRDYNSWRHSQMTHEEIIEDIRTGAEEVIKQYGLKIEYAKELNDRSRGRKGGKPIRMRGGEVENLRVAPSQPLRDRFGRSAPSRISPGLRSAPDNHTGADAPSSPGLLGGKMLDGIGQISVEFSPPD